MSEPTSTAEQWQRLWRDWHNLFSSRDEDVIDPATADDPPDEQVTIGHRRARHRGLVASWRRASAVADEIEAAVRWFLPHVREARLDPIPLRRLLGWLEDSEWGVRLDDYSDVIHLSGEARYVIDECLDVRGAAIDSAATDKDSLAAAIESPGDFLLNVLHFLADAADWCAISDVESHLATRGILKSRGTVSSRIRRLIAKGWAEPNDGRSKAARYRATETGIDQSNSFRSSRRIT